jgi:splicing factor U2AF subunit
MALDGIMFEGVAVRVRRPNDYNPAAAALLGPANPSPTLNLAAIGLGAGGGGGGGGGGTSAGQVRACYNICHVVFYRC